MRYTLEDMQTQFPNDKVCLQFLFDRRYGIIKTCPNCGIIGAKFYRIKKRMAFECKDCKHQVYPLAGTIFEKSTTPLRYWWHAIYEFSVSKNGMSAKELQRKVEVSYKTAHRMEKMIRLLMFEHERLGDLGTPIEVDEVFMPVNEKGGQRDNKTPVIAAFEVGGHVRTQVIPRATSKHAVPFIEANVRVGSTLHTDESKIYKTHKVKAFYNHDSVRHIAKEFVNKRGVTTNHVESFFGQFRRSVDGSYHSISEHYLASYAAEFSYRLNHRHEPIFQLLLAKAAKRA